MDIHKLAAEFIGTFWLVLAVCGCALFAAGAPGVGIGWMGVAFGAGLAVLSGAYAFGAISGGHFNPAVTLGVWAAGRMAIGQVPQYIVAQLLGGVLAASVAFFVANGVAGFDAVGGGFASNGFGEHSPMHYTMAAALVTEIVLTFMFVTVILCVTGPTAPAGFAPIAIGLALVVVHLVGIPVSNASVNPARSTATAIFQGGWALQQLWLFWAAPIVGGLLAGWFSRWMALAKK